jgi:hypothetical protein
MWMFSTPVNPVGTALPVCGSRAGAENSHQRFRLQGFGDGLPEFGLQRFHAGTQIDEFFRIEKAAAGEIQPR